MGLPVDVAEERFELTGFRLELNEAFFKTLLCADKAEEVFKDVAHRNGEADTVSSGCDSICNDFQYAR